MSKVKFKVSARAARLIGRENVASSQGAITELVKNSYDADAVASVVLFLRRYAAPPLTLGTREFAELKRFFGAADDCYKLSEGTYCLRPEASKVAMEALNIALEDILDLWIIDNGCGMTASAIENSWMVIGTDTKELNGKSEGGRVVTGAKGIGRFALDRLGGRCELFSAPKGRGETTHWLVDWSDFEGEGKIIDDVVASLTSESREIADIYIENGIVDLLPRHAPSSNDSKYGSSLNFDTGTAIKISVLHDVWDARDCTKLKATLESLLPPMDRGGFNIFLYDQRQPDRSGWIENFPPDQFDYRLKAQVAATGNVEITINRHEIDVARISPTTFTLPTMKASPFQKSDFEKGEFSYSRTLEELLSPESPERLADLLAIGPFDFTLYFLKLANPTKDNLLRYPQKAFDVGKRKLWLKNSGGIRLYRDNFRVRPYGEPNTQGSDWLLLGQRVASNPAAVSRRGWRVPPQQVAGTINLSKEHNPLLADQSNREGIMNERVFSAFRSIIIALIGEFENDRSYIYESFDKAYKIDNEDETKLAKGSIIAQNVLKDASQSPNSQLKSTPTDLPNPDDNDKVALAEAFSVSERRQIEQQEEIQTLRGMATLGTVLISFTHELKQIKANMGSRQLRMENALDRVVDRTKLLEIPEFASPYSILERWGREDAKVSRWVDFALTSVAPKKRRRISINLNDYFLEFCTYWQEHLASKSVALKFLPDKNWRPIMVAHEIDLDSIFYNLVINSIDAFTLPAASKNREIFISVECTEDGNATIIYRDNGPGLSSHFKRPDDIFGFGASSKTNRTENEVAGTGIGMWLLKSIVDDYRGQLDILTRIGELGFGLSVVLPVSHWDPIID